MGTKNFVPLCAAVLPIAALVAASAAVAQEQPPASALINQRADETVEAARAASPHTSESTYAYFKEESGGILLGGFEPNAKPWGMKGIPEQFKFTELNEDWDQFEEYWVLM